METNGNRKNKRARAVTSSRTTKTELPVVQSIENCDFHGNDADKLMKETARLRKIIRREGPLKFQSHYAALLLLLGI